MSQAAIFAQSYEAMHKDAAIFSHILFDLLTYMKKRSFAVILAALCLLVQGMAMAQKKEADHLLQSGPMVGYSTMREVLVWVQTKSAATAHIVYWDKELPAQRYQSDPVRTEKATAFTAKLIADQVQPGKKYSYALFLNGKEIARPYPLEFQAATLWQHRKSLLKIPDTRIALGSCTYVNDAPYDRPNKAYGDDYDIFEKIRAQKPDLMLWLGDNMYLREPDWDSRTGIFHRYTHTRSLPEMQALLGSVHHYAIWDDHDFGPNDSDRSFWNKDLTTQTFNLFWGNQNTGLGGGGITNTFWWNDAQFFMLDNRSFRSPNNLYEGRREMLGKAQIDWLIESLTLSRARFKFVAVGCQVINSAAVFENYATYAEERAELLRRIREAKIEGVIFLSGDRHYAELSRYQETGKVYPIYDFTSSSLTAGTSTPREDEVNLYRVEGTTYFKHNFGLIDITGPEDDRQLRMALYDAAGNLVWEHRLKAQDLRYPKD